MSSYLAEEVVRLSQVEVGVVSSFDAAMARRTRFAPLTGALAAFSTFAVGFFARPAGDVAFARTRTKS
jgi:hypothetical protein